MKKFILISTFALLFYSCSEDERAINPGERPDERIAEALRQYKSTLVDSEHGWKAILYPGGGAGYSFYFNFLENDRVIMLSDINAETTSEPFESTYRLRAMQRPTLIFDTYSYIHILSDPDPRKSGGATGQGRESDFEFIFESVKDDIVIFKGKYFNSKLELKKATESDAENYIKDIAEMSSAFENVNKFTSYFKRLQTGEKSFDVEPNANLRKIGLSYSSENQIRNFQTSFYYNAEGLHLLEPFNGDQITINSLENIHYDNENNKINLSINNEPAEIRSANSPIRINKEAANKVKNSQDYFLTPGFIVEGEEDAHGLYDMENFSFLIYWPSYGTDQGNVYDLLGFVFENSIYYGIATTSTISSDGRLINHYYGILGSVEEEDEEMLSKVADLWVNPSGFYLVEKEGGRLDMVSASDAKSWMNLY